MKSRVKVFVASGLSAISIFSFSATGLANEAKTNSAEPLSADASEEEKEEVAQIIALAAGYDGADDFISIDGGYLVFLSETTVAEIGGATASAATTAISNAVPGITSTILGVIAGEIASEYASQAAEAIVVEVTTDEILDIRQQDY